MIRALVAAGADDCSGSLPGWTCNVATGINNGIKQIPGLGNLVSLSESAYQKVDSLSPDNIADTWAQGLTHAVIFTLTFIQVTAQKLGTPAFDQPWWLAQYAVSFGLALIVLAFILPMLAAKIGGPEGSVSGVQLLRQSGWRLIAVVPACAFAPAALYAIAQLASALAKSFATESSVQANGAIGTLLKTLEDKAGKGWGDFGGTVMCILLMFFILVAGIILLIEMALASWGMALVGLLVPFGIVAAVYDPWSHILKRIGGLILGIIFLPPAIFFFFLTVWSSFNSNITGQSDSANSTVSMMLYLFIGLVMLDAFPLVAMWILSIVAPGTEQIDSSMRGMVGEPTMGAVSEAVFEKPLAAVGTAAGAAVGGLFGAAAANEYLDSDDDDDDDAGPDSGPVPEAATRRTRPGSTEEGGAGPGEVPAPGAGRTTGRAGNRSTAGGAGSEDPATGGAGRDESVTAGAAGGGSDRRLAGRSTDPQTESGSGGSSSRGASSGDVSSGDAVPDYAPRSRGGAGSDGNSYSTRPYDSSTGPYSTPPPAQDAPARGKGTPGRDARHRAPVRPSERPSARSGGGPAPAARPARSGPEASSASSAASAPPVAEPVAGATEDTSAGVRR